MCLCTHTQTKCDNAEHYLSGSCQIPSTSDHFPPLSACCSPPTTPCTTASTPPHKPRIRTLAEELDEENFRTPDSPGGNDPDPDDPDDDDGGNDDAPDPDTKDNPLLMLTNAISHLSHTTRCRPKDSGAACTKVHEPDTFDGMDLKKLCEFKVSFALSFLKGIALAWFEPDLLNTIPGTEPAWANNYSEFVIELTTNFSPHNPVGNAEHQLDNLLMKDGNHINKYIVEFNYLATQVHGYREGKPPCLIDLHTMAQGIDACYWEHKSEIACQTKTNPQPSSLPKQSSSGGSSSRQSGNSSSTTSSSSTGKKPQ
ncbi:hypothetical protein ID866_12131, partial [Astraeus odoratus]